MADLRFTIKLKAVPVTIVDENNAEKIYQLKELTGEGRCRYNDNFDYTIEIVEGEAKATAGKDFKLMSASEFLSMCFYDDKNVLVSIEIIKNYPATMLEELHAEALKLSGMDKESLEKVKNALEAKKEIGTA